MSGCEFGCGPTGLEYVTPGFGLVPACPVHGWVCVLLNARDERIKAAEAERDALREIESYGRSVMGDDDHVLIPCSLIDAATEALAGGTER